MLLRQLGVSPLLPPPRLVQGCSADCCALTSSRPVAPDWRHHGGVDGELRTPEQREAINDNLQSAVVDLTEGEEVHILDSNVCCDPTPCRCSADIPDGPPRCAQTDEEPIAVQRGVNLWSVSHHLRRWEPWLDVVAFTHRRAPKAVFPWRQQSSFQNCPCCRQFAEVGQRLCSTCSDGDRILTSAASANPCCVGFLFHNGANGLQFNPSSLSELLKPFA